MWTRSLARRLVLPILAVSAALQFVPAVRADEACSATRWLAVSTATDPAGNPICPDVAGWTHAPLFDRPFTGPLFCRYDRASNQAPAPPLRQLTTVSALRAAAPLCGVVLPLGGQQSATPAPRGERAVGGQVVTSLGNAQSTVPPLDPRLLYHEFRFQVGATDLPLEGWTAPGVRLAVVDTQPTGASVPIAQPAPGQGSAHGFDLAEIAHDLTCDKGCELPGSKRGRCAAEITTQLALPLSSAGSEPSTSGGYLGRPSDVALAIVREVDDWLDAGTPQHLILNLSFGWDPDLLQQVSGSAPNAEELAVYAALDYARTKGALPIAASGNSPGGSLPGHGATAPGRWYALPPVTGGLVTPANSPVVWAVGAVDRNDRPLANVRAASLPPIVAYGDHAVAPLPSGGGYTDPLTGSSVSAVVASSIAAVAWHLRGQLKADDIMALLAKSGWELPRGAELVRIDSLQTVEVSQPSSTGGISTGLGQVQEATLGLRPPSIRRLWFHSALSRAWSAERLYETESSWGANASQKVSCSNAYQMSNCGSTTWVCPGSAWSSSIACPPSPPTLQSIAAVPWVLPQPGQDPCPTCSISSGSPPCPTCRPSGNPPVAGWHVDLAIPSTWTAGNHGCLTSLLLEVATPGSSQSNRVLIVPPSGPICAGESLQVTDLPFDPGQGTATITFQVQGMNKLVRGPLYVGWQP